MPGSCHIIRCCLWGLLILGVAGGLPRPSHAQADSVAVQATWVALAGLEKELTVCENQATQLARLMDFTAARPHRAGVDAIATFRGDLTTLTLCLAPIKDELLVVQKAWPRPKTEPRRALPETPQPTIHETLAALQSRMRSLGLLMQKVTAQLDSLHQTVAPPDSTKRQQRPRW